MARFVVGVLVALGLLWLVVLLASCGGATNRARQGVGHACVRSFAPTLAAWEQKFGRVPEQCARLDAVYSVELADADIIPCRTEHDDAIVAGCTMPGERAIYLLRGRDRVQLVDSSVHEWIHAIADCLDGDRDRDHTLAGLWSEYGDGSVESQAQLYALIGECL